MFSDLRKNGVDKLQAFIQEKSGLDLLTQNACVKEVKEKTKACTEKVYYRNINHFL